MIRDAALRHAVRNTLLRPGRFNHAATDCSEGGGVHAQLPASLITRAAPTICLFILKTPRRLGRLCEGRTGTEWWALEAGSQEGHPLRVSPGPEPLVICTSVTGRQ